MAKKIQKKQDTDERLKFEILVSGLSARLIDISVTEIDDVIDDGLKQLAEFFEADRALIAQYVPAVKGWQRTHYWFSDRFDPKKTISRDGEIRPNAFPCMTENLMTRDSVVFENPDQIPTGWKEERDAVKTIGIKSSATVKLSVGGSFLGAIGIDTVLSERSWPDDIVKRLRFIGEIFANALHRKQAREALDEHMRFELLISEITAELLNPPASEIDKVIEEGLRMIGEFFDADRVVINQLLEDTGKFWPSHAWISDKDDPASDVVALGNPFELPNLADHLRREGYFEYKKSVGVTAEWKEERTFIEGLEAMSSVTVALHIRGTFMGAISIAATRHERVWPEDLVHRIKFIGEIFGRALMCKKSEESLKNAFSEIERLKARHQDDDTLLKEDIKTFHDHEEIVGQSKAIQNVLHQVEQVAGTDATVLLQGETGTGKELMALAIHEHSPRKIRPMIKVNCAAIPTTLVESELFGREKGAYTGAISKQIGRFEAADEGTIFLDEIGELSPDVQAKLLRVLQEGQIDRLGRPDSLQVNVRVVAATNRNLEEAVQDGKFREDLYYRLNVFPISIPPLRQRREDIPPLAWSFVKEFGKKMGKPIDSISRRDMEALQNYSWPGNIRELRNVIERAMILCKGSSLPIEIPRTLLAKKTEPMSLEELARKHIIDVLEMTDGRVRGAGGAAEILGLKPTTLEARMQKLGIDRGK